MPLMSVSFSVLHACAIAMRKESHPVPRIHVGDASNIGKRRCEGPSCCSIVWKALCEAFDQMLARALEESMKDGSAKGP